MKWFKYSPDGDHQHQLERQNQFLPLQLHDNFPEYHSVPESKHSEFDQKGCPYFDNKGRLIQVFSERVYIAFYLSACVTPALVEDENLFTFK